MCEVIGADFDECCKRPSCSCACFIITASPCTSLDNVGADVGAEAELLRDSSGSTNVGVTEGFNLMTFSTLPVAAGMDGVSAADTVRALAG